MKYNPETSEEIAKWLDTPEEERDLKAGALILLRLTSNRLRYLAMTQQPGRYASIMASELRKWHNFILAAKTREQLEEMKAEAEQTAGMIGIDTSEASASEESAGFSGYGKRPDHDSLSDEIRQIYADNLEIRRKMQQLHLRIRTKYAEITDCTASDVYADVVELLNQEKLYNSNWEQYDSATPDSVEETKRPENSVEEAKRPDPDN